MLNITAKKNNDKHLRVRHWTNSCPRLMVSVHFIGSNLKKYLYIAVHLTHMLYICKFLFVFLKNAGHSQTQLENGY